MRRPDRSAALLLGLLLPALLLTGCAGGGTAAVADVPAVPAVPEAAGHMELLYAKQFTVDDFSDGTSLITIAGTDRFLVVPEGTEVPAETGPDVTILRQPLDCVYLAASSAMDFFRQLDVLDTVRMTSTDSAEWSLAEVRRALETGEMLYVGKYRAPDYELVLAQGADIAIESTMIYHSPETREQLEQLGVPVLVERSSYEADPLGRLEWIKLYGLLSGKRAEAEDYFRRQLESLEDIDRADTGKTAAFFYLSSSGYAVVRKPGDYISRMIDMAGGTYILPIETVTEDNALSTMQMEMESFYEAARDADYIFYNSTIDGELHSIDELLAKSELLANFKAVQEGNVWCTEQNVFQQTTGIGEMILDMNRILTDATGDVEQLTFFHHVT